MQRLSDIVNMLTRKNKCFISETPNGSNWRKTEKKKTACFVMCQILNIAKVQKFKFLFSTSLCVPRLSEPFFSGVAVWKQLHLIHWRMQLIRHRLSKKKTARDSEVCKERLLLQRGSGDGRDSSWLFVVRSSLLKVVWIWLWSQRSDLMTGWFLHKKSVVHFLQRH
jgi:hypothetical protein